MRAISKARFIPESRHSSHKPKAFPPELYIRFLTSSIASPRLPHCILPNILRICVLTVFSLIKRSSAIFAFVCSKEKARRISSSRSVKPKSLFTACSAVSKSDVSEFSPVSPAARAGRASGAIIPLYRLSPKVRAAISPKTRWSGACAGSLRGDETYSSRNLRAAAG